MPSVCLDLTSLAYDRGVSRYTRNLVQALCRFTNVQVWGYAAGWGSHQKLQTELAQLNIPADRFLLDKLSVSWVEKLWRLGLFLPDRQLPSNTIFHAWDWWIPPVNRPVVVTIHDLAMLKHPQTAHPDVLAHHQRVWQQLALPFVQIVAVSQSTKQELIHQLQLDPQRIQVVYEALPEEFRQTVTSMSQTTYDHLKTKLDLERPFLLFVGSQEPRKNLERLIQAWLPLQKEYQLVIAGDAGWGKELPRHVGLRFIGPVSDQILAVLYGEASCFCYPSLTEGFGLPILEAFYQGTPVVTSRTGGMAEVAGNAAELVDPLDVSSISAGLQQILGENLTQQKRRLQQMIIRLQMFSWEAAATQMAKVYTDAANIWRTQKTA